MLPVFPSLILHSAGHLPRRNPAWTSSRTILPCLYFPGYILYTLWIPVNWRTYAWHRLCNNCRYRSAILMRNHQCVTEPLLQIFVSTSCAITLLIPGGGTLADSFPITAIRLNTTRTTSCFQQRISKPSERHRISGFSVITLPLWLRCFFSWLDFSSSRLLSFMIRYTRFGFTRRLSFPNLRFRCAVTLR